MEELDDNKLLEGALSIKPRDAFVTANLGGTQIVSNLSRTSSRPTTQGLSRITPNVNTRRTNFPSVNSSIITRQDSNRDPSRSFSHTSLSSHPLGSNPLRSEPPPTSIFGKWWSNCLCSCLPVYGFPEQIDSLPGYGQESGSIALPISQQNMANLVENVFLSEFQTRCPEFRLMVTYDSLNHRLIFDGTILRYCDRNRFKTAAKKVIKDTGWTQNLEELELDHLVTAQLRGAFCISPTVGRDTALCIFRDEQAHTNKTKRSKEIFMIPRGDVRDVTLERVLKDFRERDVEGSSEFFQDAKAGKISQTDPRWNRKWQLLDFTTFADCINTAWLRQNEIVVEHWREQWETTPYKAVVYWHRISEHCSLTIKSVLTDFRFKLVESVVIHEQLKLLKEDVESVCALGGGLRKTTGSTVLFSKVVEEDRLELVSSFNSLAEKMRRSELKVDRIQATNDPSPMLSDFAIKCLDKGSFADTQHRYKKTYRRPGGFKKRLEKQREQPSDNIVEISFQSDPSEISSQSDPD